MTEMFSNPFLAPGVEPVLWALDLDDNGNPVRSHRIVRREQGLAWPGQEIRVTACGLRFDADNHPDGWWLVDPGELPLAQADANHCGVIS